MGNWGGKSGTSCGLAFIISSSISGLNFVSFALSSQSVIRLLNHHPNQNALKIYWWLECEEEKVEEKCDQKKLFTRLKIDRFCFLLCPFCYLLHKQQIVSRSHTFLLVKFSQNKLLYKRSTHSLLQQWSRKSFELFTFFTVSTGFVPIFIFANCFFDLQI